MNKKKKRYWLTNFPLRRNHIPTHRLKSLGTFFQLVDQLGHPAWHNHYKRLYAHSTRAVLKLPLLL